ncbi:MAG: hypothetical protein LBE71_00915 [Dysgonamonadaceae bacterium]|nr:hypothetical protein [Dysgonamonadaceae bacterium]
MNRKIYLAAAVCLLCLSQAQAQTEYNINAGSVTITTNGTYTITGTGEPTANTIKVDSGVVADITLENVNIDVSGIENACAFDMTGATVTLVLSGTNTFKSNGTAAGLQVPEGAMLTITSISGDGSTGGTLNAAGGTNSSAAGAGIGGGYNRNGGHITIDGGTINATGGYHGASIGGGAWGTGGIITISGGTVNAIGTGRDQTRGGAAIGGGYKCSGGTITISGGFVTATAQATTGDPAAIGGARQSDAGAIAITGGAVIAIAGSGGAIGGGSGATNGSISISGGTIIATGRGIGFGAYGGSTQTTISGAPVIFATAINGWTSNPGNGIASGSDVTINQPTITLNTDFTVPENALLTIPAGWTLNLTDCLLTINSTIINHGTIVPLLVTGVSLNKDIVNLYVGDSDTLTATVFPFDVPNRNVIWESAGDAVTLEQLSDTSYKITGASAGRAVVWIETVVGGFPAFCRITVSKKPQSITRFNDDIPKTYGDEPFTLQAHATSGLPVRYESNNPTVASISGNTVTITGAGSATITAHQGGDAEYLAAASVSITLTVGKATLTVTPDAGQHKTYGDADPVLNLSVFRLEI